MKIQEDLPFARCKKCPECILKCERQVFLSDNGTEDLTVIKCKKAWRCRKEQRDEVPIRAERSNAM